jgi:predicted enzyme related to lactoylglutathione lyase
MAEFDKHEPGTFCWPELATTDQAGAVAFYRALFGWDVKEQPLGPGEVYTMFLLRGRETAAAHALRPEQREHGAPTHWDAYVTVDSAEQTAQRARALGGKVVVPAFDVMDAGRMAVVEDPTGAVLSVWEPRRHIGVKLLNEPGALCWTELMTGDPRLAETFYTQLFGWSAKTSDMDGTAYTEFSTASGRPIGGMLGIQPEWGQVPPSWMSYFQVADVATTMVRATELGAKVERPVTDLPGVGRFAILADPQGGVFAVFKPAGA